MAESARSRNRRGARAFTLIELMVVVAIVGVLAALGLVGYARWVRSSKMTEAIYMVNGIRTAQEHYYADQLSYLNLSQTMDSSYPSASPGKDKTAWGAACSNCNTGVGWDTLGISSPPVRFGYATMAGTPAKDATAAGVVLPSGITNDSFKAKHWYAVKARADTDANGVFCEVWAFSMKPDLLILNEGE